MSGSSCSRGWPDTDARGRLRNDIGDDVKATNTFEQPKRVVPQALDAPTAGTRMTMKLPARSYSLLRLAV